MGSLIHAQAHENISAGQSPLIFLPAHRKDSRFDRSDGVAAASTQERVNLALRTSH
jgi:hypothetical protein